MKKGINAKNRSLKYESYDLHTSGIAYKGY